MLLVVPNLRPTKQRLYLFINPLIEVIFNRGRRLQAIFALDVIFKKMLANPFLVVLRDSTRLPSTRYQVEFRSFLRLICAGID
jgi:hypothetical protein